MFNFKKLQINYKIKVFYNNFRYKSIAVVLYVIVVRPARRGLRMASTGGFFTGFRPVKIIFRSLSKNDNPVIFFPDRHNFQTMNIYAVLGEYS